jgi:hypothetical protein
MFLQFFTMCTTPHDVSINVCYVGVHLFGLLKGCMSQGLSIKRSIGAIVIGKTDGKIKHNDIVKGKRGFSEFKETWRMDRDEMTIIGPRSYKFFGSMISGNVH